MGTCYLTSGGRRSVAKDPSGLYPVDAREGSQK